MTKQQFERNISGYLRIRVKSLVRVPGTHGPPWPAPPPAAKLLEPEPPERRSVATVRP
jgi:hypothetical protein